MRDALVAGINLNIFNSHSERVRVANIAQLVNVLQAVILTEGEKMLLTPTYHVFEMFRAHQGAKLLPAALSCPDYAFGGERVPGVSASASVDAEGRVHVTACNLNPNQACALDVSLDGAACAGVTGRVLAAARMTAHNTFDNACAVKPSAIAARTVPGGFAASLPPMSVAAFEVK
jgi:alpha-N-arabinofuranosidase